MAYLTICLTAFFTSALTLFSGFGLGTLLLPAFAFFFPVEVAVALTAVVHLLNNIFKFVLVGRSANGMVVFRFGLPAVLAAFLGAQTLVWLSGQQPLWRYALAGRGYEVTPINFAIALLLIVFALFDLMPRLSRITFGRRYLALGGALSGYCGGLSGHQGALRAAFLMKAGLAKVQYIATNVVIACLVDLSRLSVYSTHFSAGILHQNGMLLLAATLAAFLGAYAGNLLVHKTTLRGIQMLVAVMLFGIAVALGAGLL